MSLPERTKIQLLAPVVRGRKGQHVKVFESARRSGYVRVVVDDNVYELSEEINLDKNKKHNIEIMVDRLVVREGIERRLTDSIESVMRLSDGLLIVEIPGGERINFSQSFSCADCGVSIDEIEPRIFSFNNPFGACEACHGIGYNMEFDEELILPDPALSLAGGALVVSGWQSVPDQKSFSRCLFDALATEYGFSLDTPYCELPEHIQDIIMHGTGGKEVKVYYKGQRGEGVYDVAFEGVIKNVERRYRETNSEVSKREYESFMRITPCKACKGRRLKKEALAVTIADKNIAEITDMPVSDLKEFLEELKLSEWQLKIGKVVLKEIRSRVRFLVDVGLDYLSLSRYTGSLSGGEAQRVKLVTELSRRSTGKTVYVLDELTTGLHFADVHKLVDILRRLAEGGNTVIVIEHNLDVIKTADYIIDMGPEGGKNGGRLLTSGTPEEVAQVQESYTGYYIKKMLEKR